MTRRFIACLNLAAPRYGQELRFARRADRKFEIRRPKVERRPKSEGRRSKKFGDAGRHFRISAFGFRPSFGLRTSAFGFPTAPHATITRPLRHPPVGSPSDSAACRSLA